MDRPVTIASQRGFLDSFPERGVFHVAVRGGNVVGVQDVVPVGGDGHDHVGDISTFVAMDAQRIGVGRRLTTATLAAARTRGFTKVTATIRADNAGALGFYEALDFIHVGTLRKHARVRGELVDQVLMERLL